MRRRNIKHYLHNIGAVFFLLWIISLATDILGQYDYKEVFLIISLVLWTLGSFIDGFRAHKGLGKDLSSAFRKAGTTLFGIWIVLLIFGWFDWLGNIWDGKVNYVLGLSLIIIAISFTIRAMTIKNTNWRLRSTFYSLGFLIILSWILMRVFELFVEYQDATILAGIGALAIGYIIGASRKTHDYDIFDDKIEEISKAMKEVKEPPTATGDIKVLEEDLKIGEMSSLKIKKGSIFVDMKRDSERCGNVFFGEGSYSISSDNIDRKENFMGMVYVTGERCPEIEMSYSDAKEKDIDNLGLERDDIKELSNIFVKGGKDSFQRLKDIKLKIVEEGKKTEINLPFIKVLEGIEGDYVKFGPIEVADLKGKGSHIRVGNREFKDKDFVEHRETGPYQYSFNILTTEDTLFLAFSEDETILESKDLKYNRTGDEETIEKGELSFRRMNGMQSLRLGEMEATINEDYMIRSKGADIRVEGEHITFTIGDRKGELDDKEASEMIKELMRRAMPNLVKDSMEGSRVLFNELIMQVANELEG